MTLPAERAVGFTGYPIATIERAKVMRAGGWSLRRVADMVAEEVGQRPAITTVREWSDPHIARERAAVRHAQHRAYSASGAGAGARLGNHRHTPEFRLARLVALREAGVTFASISRAMTFDYGEVITEAQVRYALTTNRYPRSLA